MNESVEAAGSRREGAEPLSIGGATMVIAVFTGITKIAGFLRDRTLAVAFGVGAQSDAYTVATWLPTLPVSFVTSAVGTAMLPVIVDIRTRCGREASWRTAYRVLNMVFLICLAISLAGIALAGPLARLAAPGFSAGTSALTASLLRIAFPLVLLLGLFSVGSTMLHAHRCFAIPAAAPLAANIVTITGIVVLGRHIGVAGAVVGLVGGFALQALLVLPFLLANRRWYTPSLGLKDPEVVRMLRLAGPVLFLSLFTQASGMIEKFLASGLASGSVAALSFANKLILLPVSLFSTAVTTAMFPWMAEAYSRDDMDGVRRSVDRGIRMMAYVMLPAMAGLAYMRVPIVRALFERGAFTGQATAVTAQAVLWYSIGMPFLSVSPILDRALVASHDTMTSSAAGIGRLILFGLAAVPLARTMGHSGIAFASSIAVMVYCVALVGLLKVRLGIRMDLKGLGMFISRIAVGCVVMIAAASGMLRLGQAVTGAKLGPVLAAIVAGAAVYFVVTALLGVQEGVAAVTALFSRLQARHSPTG